MKIFIIKCNKLIYFVYKSFVGWIVVEGYELVEFVNDLEERKSFY